MQHVHVFYTRLLYNMLNFWADVENNIVKFLYPNIMKGSSSHFATKLIFTTPYSHLLQPWLYHKIYERAWVKVIICNSEDSHSRCFYMPLSCFIFYAIKFSVSSAASRSSIANRVRNFSCAVSELSPEKLKRCRKLL